MNRHLNIYKTYAKENRSYQLENDLTRAFAITLQEDPLVLGEVLKNLIPKRFDLLFSDPDSESNIEILIQQRVSDINEFDDIIAVSLSATEMQPDAFKNQTHNILYDPICDLVIRVNEILIIVEAKRDNIDCAAQLYNQVFNILEKNNRIEEFEEIVTPVDLNWPKLMGLCTKVLSFEASTGNINRFLSDFVGLVKEHNFRWFPELPLGALKVENTRGINRRFESALIESAKHLNVQKLRSSDRMGLEINRDWAKELLLSFNEIGDLVFAVYPGNTKGQGYGLFRNEPKFKKTINSRNVSYPTSYQYHVKFTSFQKYFSGLWFSDNELKKELYTVNNFHKYTGRKYRGADWSGLEKLFDQCFKESYNWRDDNHSQWDQKMINSGKNRFDVSFGYEVTVTIPYSELKKVDIDKDEIGGLVSLISDIYHEFEDILISK